MSYRTLTTKQTLNTSIQVLLKRGAHIGLGVSAFAPMLALANPTGGQVVAGSATIKNSNANTTVVKQSSSSAIIDWQQFNIGKGQYVQFLQPSSSSVILNRVIGGGGTSIFGSLTGNGQVFLVNTNGVFFGKGSSIDAQGFLASTLDISDSNFLSGHYLFDKGTNANAQVINQGNITAHKGGYVVLAGDYAENDGLISAQSGHIVLASGAKSTLTLNGNSLVSYAINQATLANLAGANNAGKLSADGGTVLMTADVANLLKATVVNNTGLIEAHAISKDGGTIQLLATGGNIQNAGTLDASATHAGQQGGTITLKGDERTTLTDASKIFATGDGANGGNVEVSGNTLSMRGAMNIGKGGNLLLDPNVVTIVTGSGNAGASQGTGTGESANVGVDFIQTQLNNNTNVHISAHNFIDASTNVKTIKATGTGDLDLHTGSAESGINLHGVDVTIGGAFNASFGYAHFGHITAKSISLVSHNSGGSVGLVNAVVNSKGVVTTNSLKATGGNVTVNAHRVFSSNESGAIAVNATGSIDFTGNISAPGEDLTLAAHDIDVGGSIVIGGALKATASGGYAEFGKIEAGTGVTVAATNTTNSGSVTAGSIHAYAGNITLTDAHGRVGVGNVNADAGAVALTASSSSLHVGTVQASGNVTLTAKKGSITVGNSVNAGGVLTVAASAEGDINVAGSGEAGLFGAKGVVLNGDFVAHSNGFLEISASHGDVTATAGLGFDSGEGIGGSLELRASGTVKVSKGVFAQKDLFIEAGGLAYTGTGDLHLEANHGNLILDAAIGTKTTPAKFGVNLLDYGGFIDLKDSIFTAGSINATQIASGSAGLEGVIVGNSSGYALSFSAKKSISLSGANIGIGSGVPSHGNMGKVTINAGQNITFAAQASGSNGSHNGQLSIKGGDAGNAANLDRSITIKAGKDISITAQKIQVSGGTAIAGGGTASHHLSVNNDASVSITAGSDMTLTAVEGVQIHAGAALVQGGAGKKGVVTLNADASVSPTAGGSLGITGSNVQMSIGYGAVFGSAIGKAATLTESANVGLNLKAGKALVITGNGASAEAGVLIGTNHRLMDVGGAFVLGADGGAMTANLAADIDLTAGTALSVSGHHVRISAGYGMASANGPFPTGVFGGGSGAAGTAKFTGNANVNIKSGTGGVTLQATGSNNTHSSYGVSLTAAGDLARGLLVKASDGGKASADLEGNLTITTTGDLDIVGRNIVNIGAGDHDGYGAVVRALNKGSAKLTTSGNVSIAAKNVNMNSGEAAAGSVIIQGGFGLGAYNSGSGNSVHSGGSAAIADSARVDIKASGNIVLQGFGSHGEVIVATAPGVGDGGYGIADAGKLTVKMDAGISLTAGGNITMNGSQQAAVFTGPAAGEDHSYRASNGGTLTATAISRVDITAGGNFHLSGFSASMDAGSQVGRDVGVFASSHGKGATKATVSNDASINVSAGSLTFSDFGGNAGAGHNLGASGAAIASGAKAVTSVTDNASVNINVKGDVLISTEVAAGIFGGLSAGLGAFVGGFSGGKANYSANASITLKGANITFLNHGGGEQSIVGARRAGVSGRVEDSGAGASANATIDASATVIATGTLTMTGASRAKFIANPSDADQFFTSNDGGVKTVTTINNGVNVTAKSMTISAENSVEVFAGNGVDAFGQVIANGGAATLNVTSGVSLTATQGISLTVTGTGGSSSTVRRIMLIGGSRDGAMSANARHGGKAALNVANGVTIKAGGAISLKNTGVGATSTTISGSGTTAASNVHHAFHGIIAVGGSRIGTSFTTHHATPSGSPAFQHRTEAQTGTGGGTATIVGDASLTISAKGAFSMDAGSGQAVLAGGSSAGFAAEVLARNAGKASATFTQNASLTAASATINGGSVILAAGGENNARRAEVFASHAATATLDAESLLKVNLTGALTVTGNKIGIVGGEASPNSSFGFGGLANSASISASHGGAAALIAKSSVQIKAGSVSLTANSGQLVVAAGFSDGGAKVFAAGKGDKASMTVDGTVNIAAATGGITLKALGSHSSSSATGSNSTRGNLSLKAGGGAGAGAGVISRGAGAVTGLTIDTSLNLSAKGAISASGQSQVVMDAGFGLGASDLVLALAKGTKTTVSETSALNVSGGSITVTGRTVGIAAGGEEAAGALIVGSHSGVTAVTQNANASLKATGDLSVTAKDLMSISGGRGASGAATQLIGSHHGTVTLTQQAGMNLQAGGNVTLKVTDTSFGSPTPSGGSNLHSMRLQAGSGFEVDEDALEAGTATFTRDSSLNVKAGGAMTATGPLVLVFGGGADRITSNTFIQGSGGVSGGHVFTPGSSESNVPFDSHAGGKATGTLTSQVNITAGTDVTLGGKFVTVVEAGGSNQLFVGAARVPGGFSGERWNGGAATLSLNTNVTVSAGRDLALTGSSIQVLGMQSGNQANVMGGSSSAVAKLNLQGNTNLSAKRDITISGDSASVVGGSLGNLRADHASGNVTILGSADANLKAGRDVLLNLGGNLTVAGAGVNSSHRGAVRADAHADNGFASITGHGDANITAVRNITNGSTGSLFGVNVIGGNNGLAVTLGQANNQKATATANANLTAGGAITLNGGGDLTVAGGLGGSAGVTRNSSSQSADTGQRAASLQARAGITAKGAVSLTFAGDGVIAGGGLTAQGNLVGDRFMTATAVADAGVQIKGSSVTLNVGGNLLVRGGSSVHVNAFGIGTDDKATITGSANAVIAATGNVSITAGANAGGGASFVGGSAGGASVQVFGSGNTAIGTVHSDVSVTAGKAISLNVTGDLKIAAGPGVEASNLVLAGLPNGILGSSGSFGADAGTATATATGKVGFSAGTTLTVTATGDVNVLGGSHAASGAVVTVAGGDAGTNGKHDTAKLTVDASVTLSAKGALTVSADGGTSSVHVTTFVPSNAGSSHFVPPVTVANSGSFASANHNVASANINESVKLVGKTITLNIDPHGDIKFSGDGLVLDGSITENGHGLAGFHPQVAAPQGLRFGTESLYVAPLSEATSFGGVHTLGGADVSTPAVSTTSVSGGVDLPAPAVISLDTLQVQGLVVNLVTLMADQPKTEEQGTVFVPRTLATAYDASFPSSCKALILKADGGRCSVGGK